MEGDAKSIANTLRVAGEPSRPYRSEEQDLWLAVILNEIHTAFVASDAFLRNSEGKGADADLVRGDSHRFLTMAWGPWAESRELVCQAAGVDAEMLARVCRKRLALWREAQRTAEVIRLDRAFADLIDRADGMAAADLDAALAELAALEAAA